jgi:hypothetical protein
MARGFRNPACKRRRVRDQARERLARFGDRVRFIVASMEEPPNVGLPVGVLTNACGSAHHFNVTSPRRFYRVAARLQAQGPTGNTGSHPAHARNGTVGCALSGRVRRP